MKTIITSNPRPLHRALCILLLGIASLWAMPRSARAQVLYVVQNIPNSVSEYNATTGAVINANFITGLDGPEALVLSGNNLFVANAISNTVGEYNATTGAVINANLITGLDGPEGLALSGNSLFVSNGATDTVGKYDATTGAAMGANFITELDGPVGLAAASVPELSTWSMIAVGGVALLGIMHRKKHRTA